jgi:hypothetical protein
MNTLSIDTIKWQLETVDAELSKVSDLSYVWSLLVQEKARLQKELANLTARLHPTDLVNH